MSSDRVERRPDDRNTGLAQLLDRCVPWLPPQQVAQEILACGGQTFALSHWAILWTEPYVGQLRAAEWFAPVMDPRPMLAFHHAVLPNLRVPADDLPALLDRPLTLAWEPILRGDVDPSPDIWFGLDQAEHTRVSAEWQFSAARLLSWAIQFQQQLHRQKLESMAEYAAGAGHEINNPLGSIIGRAAQLLKEESDPERKRFIETIGAQAYRIRDMIGDTMLFGRPPAPRMVLCELGKIIRQVEQKFREPLQSTGITLDIRCDDSFTITADPTQLEIVISELLRNSLFELSQGGDIRIQCALATSGNAEGIQMDFSDSGAGLNDEQRLHCFDPFYSGRQAGRGHGFGLSKCWQILRQHRGSIELLPGDGRTTFRVWWPVREE